MIKLESICDKRIQKPILNLMYKIADRTIRNPIKIIVRKKKLETKDGEVNLFCFFPHLKKTMLQTEGGKQKRFKANNILKCLCIYECVYM